MSAFGKVLGTVLVAVVVALVWLRGTPILLSSENAIVFNLGFWLGYWTVTGWIAYVATVACLSAIFWRPAKKSARPDAKM